MTTSECISSKLIFVSFQVLQLLLNFFVVSRPSVDLNTCSIFRIHGLYRVSFDVNFVKFRQKIEQVLRLVYFAMIWRQPTSILPDLAYWVTDQGKSGICRHPSWPKSVSCAMIWRKSAITRRQIYLDFAYWVIFLAWIVIIQASDVTQ